MTMGLTRLVDVYCAGPMMVGVEMEAEGALLQLFPHEAKGDVKAGRQKSHVHRVLSAFAPAWLPPARGVNILWANGSALRHMRTPMHATSTKPSMYANGIMLPITGATRWYSRPRAWTVIPLGPLRGRQKAMSATARGAHCAA
jgi:hypothetical protein